MKNYVLGFALLTAGLLSACNHPLVIQGQGDIISETGDRDCLLEQQPCENIVVNEYVETYSAVPRAGSYFEGWEGCGDQFPKCEINVPAETVKEHWGETTIDLVAVFKEYGAPSDLYELIDWKLDLPINDNGEYTGIGQTIGETELANGYESEFFYTSDDGGIVMRAPVRGAKTSINTSFTRTELREMLRRGDTSIKTKGANAIPNGNNWAFSTQPAAAQADAGGINGTLRVTMAVNEVTTTGSSSHVGRLIIGQIHASDDEPIRLYYRKLPGNENGTIYAAHEIRGGEDVYFDIIGGRSSSQPNLPNGIPLNERFTYEIVSVGNLLTVNIIQENEIVATTDIDMSNSGYDILNDYMYFKAGVYHVNNTGDDNDYAQVTLYELTNTHEGYPY